MTSQKLQHLLSIDQLDSTLLLTLLQRAQHFSELVFNKEAVLTHLQGKIVTHLFFENSTRTRNSFEIAAARLGAINLTPDLNSSSLSKGESFLDTVLNLEALGTRIFVIRHAQEHFFNELIERLQATTHLVNAGDGSNEHPSQTLLDLLTIQQHQPDFTKLRIAIIGDILHSRVVPSLLKALQLLKTPDIRLIAPSSLLPKEAPYRNVSMFNSMREGLAGVDVIMSLRLQKERMGSAHLPLLDHFAQDYCLNSENLSYANSGAIVMHPGPINRGIEIDSAIADGPQSVILQQVRNGVLARMAILDYLLSSSNTS